MAAVGERSARSQKFECVGPGVVTEHLSNRTINPTHNRNRSLIAQYIVNRYRARRRPTQRQILSRLPSLCKLVVVIRRILTINLQ